MTLLRQRSNQLNSSPTLFSYLYRKLAYLLAFLRFNRFACVACFNHQVPHTVDSGTASEGDLLGIKSRTPSAGGAGGNRGLWYTLIGLFRILSTRSFRNDCVPWPGKEAGGRRSSRPVPAWRGDVL